MPGEVAYACNPSTLGGWGGPITWGQEFQTSLTNTEELCLYQKYKISQAWWCMPVIPATQEAEAGESLEPKRQRLRWAEIRSLHSSLGKKSKTPSQKKQKQKQKTKLLWQDLQRTEEKSYIAKISFWLSLVLRLFNFIFKLSVSSNFLTIHIPFVFFKRCFKNI